MFGDGLNALQVYISRVPPFMKPQKLKSLLEQYGSVHRIYLVPEGRYLRSRIVDMSKDTDGAHSPDESSRKRRARQGGNKKQLFTEGWIEFDDKRIAKAVARSLNGQPIGMSCNDSPALWPS